MKLLLISLSFLLLLVSPLAVVALLAPSNYYSKQRTTSLAARFAWQTNDQHEFSSVRKQWVTTPLHPRDVPNSAKSSGLSMDYTNDAYRGGGRMLPPARGRYYNNRDARRRRRREGGWDGRDEYNRYDVRYGEERRDYEDDEYRRYPEERLDYPEEERRGWRRGEWARQGQSRNQQMRNTDYNDDEYRRREDEWAGRSSNLLGRRDRVREVAPSWQGRRNAAEPRRRTTARARDSYSSSSNNRDDDFLSVWEMNLHYMVPSHIPVQVFDEMTPRERMDQDEILIVDGNVLRNKLPKYSYFRKLMERDVNEYMARYYY